jgi:hypothetical protein
MQIGCRRVEPGFHPQGLAGRKLLPELGLDQEFVRPSFDFFQHVFHFNTQERALSRRIAILLSETLQRACVTCCFVYHFSFPQSFATLAD